MNNRYYEYFFNEGVLENFLNKLSENRVVLTTAVGRVKKNNKCNRNDFQLYKENLFNKVETEHYRSIIKCKISNIIHLVSLDRFQNFKNKYKSIKYAQILENAMNIKNENPNYTKDIGKFLYKNGICLLIEKYPKEDWKGLDGFSCFYNQHPIIVIYEQKDKRRMLFTIMHELYHLLYDENEKLADSFASSTLLTSKDLEKFKTFNKKNSEDIKKYLNNCFDIIKKICEYNYVSTTAAIKALIREKIFLKKEKYYTEVLAKELKNLRKILSNDDNYKINIISTKDLKI